MKHSRPTHSKPVVKSYVNHTVTVDFGNNKFNNIKAVVELSKNYHQVELVSYNQSEHKATFLVAAVETV